MYSNKLILNKYILSFGWIIALSLVLVNPAMAQLADSETAAAAEATVAETANAVAEEAATEVVEVDPGMQIPVDGSSLDAFNDSLAKIKEQATEANYITLEEAIKYLLVYDLGAGRDRAKLAKNLDGLTGEQIIDKVSWRR